MRLIESSAARRRSPAGVMMSVAVHLGVISLAVVATVRADIAPAPPPEQLTIFAAPPPEPTPRRAAGSRGAAGASSTTPSAPRLPSPVPPIDVAIDLPAAHPPLLGDPTAGDAFDSRGLSGRSRAGNGVGSGDERPLDALTVERAVVPLSTVRPRYPEALRAAGVSGRVVARFVVDTLGRVEDAGVEITEATHPLFADAVRRTLASLRFRAADAGGRRVRQLVEMPFEFVVR